MNHDLFGEPIPRLRKNASGYLADLAELTYAEGWSFWSLAQPGNDRPRPANRYECVWLVGPGYEMRCAYIDLTTGTEVTP